MASAPHRLSWLPRKTEVPWRRGALARNLEELGYALAESHPPEFARCLREAVAWHVQMLAAHAYRQGLDEAPSECHGEAVLAPAPPPLSTRPAQWLDDSSEARLCG